MKKIMYAAISLLISLPAFGQSAKDFVGTWKSDPGGPNMTRKLELDGGVIVMTEIQPGRNGGPETTVVRKYPTDGSTVTIDGPGPFAGATATGRMEGSVLTVDTTMTSGQKFHDIWTLSPDGKAYTNEMVISGGRGGGGGRARGAEGGAAPPPPPADGAARAGGNGGGRGAGRGFGRGGPIKFSFTKQ